MAIQEDIQNERIPSDSEYRTDTVSQNAGQTSPSEALPDEELLYDLADLFKVFSDTTRIKVLYALMGGELCVADIAEITGSTQSAVSHQLRILKQARLVKFRREGRNIVYTLADEHVHTMLAQGMDHICE
ncbi:MAG: helix-turn-helix transcriptional regulator [Coriobacteriales bacterium]|nr:helix-turn-helix transcriptional regulator [Coriobacteriales bacterium]